MDLDETYLDLEQSATKMWLVKIPKFVAEQWEEIMEPGVELGRLRIYKNKNSNSTNSTNHPEPPKISLVLPDQQDFQMPIPKRYNVTITSMAARNQYIVGSVEHEATCGPVIDNDYRRIMQMRTQSAADQSNSRQTQILNGKASNYKNLIATSGNQWDAGSKFLQRGKKNVADKRERMPRKDLEDMVFREFALKTHYSLKQLIECTQQPVIFLKEVLTDLCDLNKRGPNANMYELKVEFSTPIQPAPAKTEDPQM